MLASASAAAAFRFAGPPGSSPTSTELAGTRIATSYVGVVRAFLEERGIDAESSASTARSRRASSSASPTSIADVVETGSTLRQAGLEVFGETILDSEAVLITRAGRRAVRASRSSGAGVEGVLVGPELRDDGLRHRAGPRHRRGGADARHRGPDRSLPLHREGWVAVRAMVPRDGAQRLMDELYELGARGILLTDIHACRL